MAGYTKLFGSIIYSTIWREPDAVRLVWITMLAMADRNGVVEASVPGLADAARVKLLECEKALRSLKAADPHSRSQEHQGRRIEDVDGGWKILNHGKYRAKLGAENKRESNRVRQERHRRKKKGALRGENAAVKALESGDEDTFDRISGGES